MFKKRYALSSLPILIIVSLCFSARAEPNLPVPNEFRAPRIVLDDDTDDPIAIIGKPQTQPIEEWRTGDGSRVTKVRTFWGSYCVTVPLSAPSFMRNDIGSNVTLPTNCPK